MTDPVPDPTIDAVRRAVQAVPDDPALRLHLARLLIAAGHTAEAVTEIGQVLAVTPDNQDARALMLQALSPSPPTPLTRPTPPPSNLPTVPAVPGVPAAPTDPTDPAASSREFDWSAAEDELQDVVRPMFTGPDRRGPDRAASDPAADRLASDPATPEPASAFEIRRPDLRLADVGGMQGVKERLQASFLAPLQQPELRRLYGKSLRGGLLLYGPPGCGKTYLARALAGELGAGFLSVGLADVLDMWVGSSERNLAALFDQARRSAPCVVFLDEVDALGQKRSQTAHSSMRSTVNQLLTELDGVAADNEGVYLLAATNQPWDVDPALRRPGRLDRTLLVLPPDGPAREAILRHHLAHRPVEGIDLAALAAATNGFSGADLAYVCELATERALMSSATSGTVRLIGMPDLRAALADVTPSTRPWLQSARTVVQYGEDDGTFAELKAYLKKHRR